MRTDKLNNKRLDAISRVDNMHIPRLSTTKAEISNKYNKDTTENSSIKYYECGNNTQLQTSELQNSVANRNVTNGKSEFYKRLRDCKARRELELEKLRKQVDEENGIKPTADKLSYNQLKEFINR